MLYLKKVVYLATFFFIFLASSYAEPNSIDSLCQLTQYDEQHVKVSRVHDGDTLNLSDGRRVRIIGINTPELSRNGRSSQPFSRKALHHLRTHIEPSNVVHLTYDSEKKDKYGRLLAYVSNHDGSNVGAELIAAGLATILIVPPNLAQLDCHKQIEAEARKQKRGLWQLPQYERKRANALDTGDRGYRFIEGMVTKVALTETEYHIMLDDRVTLWIAPDDYQRYFQHIDLPSLVNHHLVARGWLHKEQSILRMRSIHPQQWSTP